MEALMAYQDNSFAALLHDLIGEIGQLFRQELQLARAEAGEKIAQAQNGVIAVIVGLLLAFSGLLILLQALVLALSEVVPAWLASVIVGGAVAIIAFILVYQGQRNLKPANLMPERTLSAMRRDRNMVMEKVDESGKQVA
jgi:Putative Actinobacterial Holin-X, holin superfamily III